MLGCFPAAAAANAANAVDVFAGGDSDSDSDDSSSLPPSPVRVYAGIFLFLFRFSSKAKQSKATTTLSAASSFCNSPEELACVFKCSQQLLQCSSTAAQGNDSKHNKKNYSCTLCSPVSDDSRTRDR